MKVYNWNAAVDSVMIRIVGIFDMNYNTDVRLFANLIGIHMIYKCALICCRYCHQLKLKLDIKLTTAELCLCKQSSLKSPSMTHGV